MPLGMFLVIFLIVCLLCFRAYKTIVEDDLKFPLIYGEGKKVCLIISLLIPPVKDFLESQYVHEAAVVFRSFAQSFQGKKLNFEVCLYLTVPSVWVEMKVTSHF